MIFDEPTAEPAKRRRGRPPELRLCARCKVATFDPYGRDVSGWLVIEDENASDYCAACWREMCRHRGRVLGQLNKASANGNVL